MNTNKTICLNSKGGRNGIEGLQPSLNDRIYDSNGISTCVATSNFFMPNYTIYNNKKGVDNMNSETTNLRIRKLTPKECWRLMGFDDEDFEKAKWYSKKETDNILGINYPRNKSKKVFSKDGQLERMSDTQLYKQAGNSIVVNVLEAIFKNMNLPNDIKILELFGGIGACTKALKRIGKKPTIMDYVEIDKYAVASYNAMHNTNFEPQDICTWDKDIKVDLIMHGSPCQDFSLAGKQAGGDKDSGTRSSLMYETIRIVEKLKPKYVIWENVKNLLSKKHRHNFDAYLQTMEQLGYVNYYQVLNAKDYGIPQNRERVFTISILGDEKYTFPKEKELKKLPIDLIEENVDTKYDLTEKNIKHYQREFGSKGKELNLYEPIPTLTASMGTGGGNIPYFTFPPKQELKLKLKDLLEDEVDEKYYLSNKMIEYISANNEKWTGNNDKSIINKKIASAINTGEGSRRCDASNYICDGFEENTDLKGLSYLRDFGSRGKLQNKEYCDTLTASMETRDWKDPKCVEVVRKYGVFDTEKSKHQAGSVYDINGLAPTLDTMQGGYRQPCIETKNATKQSYVESKYKEFINENGYMLDMFNPYNKTEIKDIAPTQSTQCGSTTSSATVLIKENRWSDLD